MDFKKWFLNEVGTSTSSVAQFVRPAIGMTTRMWPWDQEDPFFKKKKKRKAESVFSEIIQTPPHMPHLFYKETIAKLKELERKLKPMGVFWPKLEKIEAAIKGHARDHFYRLARYLPYNFREKGIVKPYSDEIQTLIDYTNYKGVLPWDVVKMINMKLSYGFNADPELNTRFWETVNKLLGKEYSDGSGGGYIDNMIDEIKDIKNVFDPEEDGFTDTQAIAILEKGKELVRALAEYVKQINAYERKLKAYGDLLSRKIDAHFNSGGKEKPAKSEGVDVLFHATPKVKEILANGFMINQTQALGGHTDDAVSFTADFNIAVAIVRGIREAIAIARGHVSPEQVIQMAQKERIDLRARGGETWWKSYEKDPNRKIEVAWELFRHYLAYSNLRYDPLFFAVKPENFVDLDPANVGIIQAKVDLSKVKKYLYSMEEYRVPLEAIKSIRAIKV